MLLRASVVEKDNPKQLVFFSPKSLYVKISRSYGVQELLMLVFGPMGCMWTDCLREKSVECKRIVNILKLVILNACIQIAGGVVSCCIQSSTMFGRQFLAFMLWTLWASWLFLYQMWQLYELQSAKIVSTNMPLSWILVPLYMLVILAQAVIHVKLMARIQDERKQK